MCRGYRQLDGRQTRRENPPCRPRARQRAATHLASCLHPSRFAGSFPVAGSSRGLPARAAGATGWPADVASGASSARRSPRADRASASAPARGTAVPGIDSAVVVASCRAGIWTRTAVSAAHTSAATSGLARRVRSGRACSIATLRGTASSTHCASRSTASRVEPGMRVVSRFEPRRVGRGTAEVLVGPGRALRSSDPTAHGPGERNDPWQSRDCAHVREAEAMHEPVDEHARDQCCDRDPGGDSQRPRQPLHAEPAAYRLEQRLQSGGSHALKRRTAASGLRTDRCRRRARCPRPSRRARSTRGPRVSVPAHGRRLA